MYDARIQRDGDAKELQRVFEAEDKAFPNGRASYETAVNDNTLTINARADDTSSLKAVLNSITTILEIYDRTQRFTEPAKE